MAIIKIEPYIIDTTGDFTFNNVTATGNLSSLNANLGNTATANFFIGSGNNLSNIQGANVTGQAGNALVAGTVYTNAQPNITSVGTLTGLTSTGTVNLTGASNVALGPVANVQITGGSNGQYLQTDGSGILTWSTVASGSSSNISNGNSNVNIPSANGNINFSAVGNANVVVITGTGANISGTANITGNLTAGNIIAGNGSGGNITNANVISANTITALGNLNGTELNLSGNGVFGGNLTVNGTLTYINSTTLSISDPIINLQTGPNGAAPVANTGKDVGTALNYYDTTAKIAWMGWDVSNAEIAFGSNVSISSEVVTFTELANIRSGNAQLGNNVSANFFIGAGNNLSNISGSNVSGQVGNSLVASTVYTNAQPNITSVGTLTSLAVTGNISAGNADLGNVVTANFFIGNFYGTANSATTAGTVTTAAQPNITSVGSLTGLTVSNATGVVDFTTTANVTLGTVANLHIAGGTNGYVLSTDGSGTLTWVAQSGGGSSNISNGNSNVNIPVADGNINFSAVGNANVVVITGTGSNISGTLNVTGNATLGNIITSGSGGNISNANVISANTITALGNLNGVELNLSGNGVFGGNLTVNGTLTYINSTTLSISDPIINLQTGPNGAAPVANTGKDVGTALNYYDTSAKIAWMGWDVSNAEIAFGSNVGISSEVVTFTELANIRSGNASLGNSAVANYFTGNFYGTANSATTAGTVTTNAQPNITSTGSLTGLTVSNATGVVDFTTTANVTLGAVANLHISGGTNGYVLSTDGSSTLSWVAQSGGGGSPGGTDTQVQFNDSSAFGGNAGLTFNKTTTTLTANNFVATSTANLGSNANVVITGGTNGYVLSTNGSGVLSWVAQSGGGGGASISNGTSNVDIATSGGNVTTSVGGTANVLVVTSTGANITGTLNVTGQSNLGVVGNVVITGGTNGYVLSTNGSGGLSWIASGGGGGASISNGTSNVNIAAVDGNITMGVAGVANVVTVSSSGVSAAIKPRVITITDGTTVTMNADTTDMAIQTNTQTAGTLTIAAPTGTLYDGQKLMFRLQSANVQTFSWNAIFDGSTDLTLPITSSGNNKYDYAGFIYNSASTKWDIIAKNFGF